MKLEWSLVRGSTTRLHWLERLGFNLSVGCTYPSSFAVAKLPAIIYSADVVSTLSHFSDAQKKNIFLYFFKNATIKTLILKVFFQLLQKSADLGNPELYLREQLFIQASISAR